MSHLFGQAAQAQDASLPARLLLSLPSEQRDEGGHEQAALRKVSDRGATAQGRDLGVPIEHPSPKYSGPTRIGLCVHGRAAAVLQLSDCQLHCVLRTLQVVLLPALHG